MEFYKRFDQALKEKGLTNAEFHKLSGISNQMISNYRKGYGKPSEERQQLIENLLEMKPETEKEELPIKLKRKHPNRLFAEEAGLLMGISAKHIRRLVEEGKLRGYILENDSRRTIWIGANQFQEDTGIEVPPYVG